MTMREMQELEMNTKQEILKTTELKSAAFRAKDEIAYDTAADRLTELRNIAMDIETAYTAMSRLASATQIKGWS